MQEELNLELVKKAFTQESPAKVFSLTAVAMFSLAFLFMVSYTDAGFEGTRTYVPEVFSEANVLSALDNAAAGYSKFAEYAFLNPLKQDFAMYKENFDWVIDNSDMAILQTVGLEKYAMVEPTVVHEPKVAGAFVRSSSEPNLLDALYSVITK